MSACPKICLAVLLSLVASTCVIPAQTIYNVQLNGLGSHAGRGRIGSSGDTWNNPALTNIDGTSHAGTTILATNVALVDNGGAASPARFSISALNFRGFTEAVNGGNPVSGLNSQAYKFDWNGTMPVPTLSISVNGLPTNALIGLVAYGAAYQAGYPVGSTWTLDALNGGAKKTMGYGGDNAAADPAGMNIMLPSSEDKGWTLLEGNTDDNGGMTVVVSPCELAGAAWWQTYLNGFQLQLYSAPVVAGLTNQTVIEGNTATLSPTITEFPITRFHWQENGADLTDATNASLILPDVQFTQDGNVYSLIASNILGVVTNSMILTVIVSPEITGLTNQLVASGSDVTLAALVTGEPAPVLQWLRNGTNIAGATTASHFIPNAQESDSDTYSLVAGNAAGVVTNSMTLVVSSTPVEPEILGPSDQTVNAGSNATFMASVSGLPFPTLQWEVNGVPISGATSTVLILTNVQSAQNGYTYSLIASNTAGMTSNSATLNVLFAPLISEQPRNLAVIDGEPALFSVTVTANPAAAYRWYKDGGPIMIASNSTATNASLDIPSATSADAGIYHVAVSNVLGAVISSNATLTVNPVPPPSIANLLTLTNGGIQFAVSGPAGDAFSVWATTNVSLAPVTNTWTLITNDTFGGSPFPVLDFDATNFPQRFYLITVP